MNRRVFTKEQINEILKNPYVRKCSEMTITYVNDFKVKAVKQHIEQHMTAKEIFIKAGFDLELIGQETPHWCLKSWTKIYRTKGLEKLKIESRGKSPTGRPRKTEMTTQDRIKRLEMENAYLRAENDFLTKLRAKRAE